MKAAAVWIILAMMMAPLLLLPSASAVTLTSSWQIEARNSQNETTSEFEAKSIMNITVYPPSSLVAGGVRSLIIHSQSKGDEIARYSLGYYSSGNQAGTAKNVSVNLGVFPDLIHGDTLLIQVRNPSDQVEFTTGISVGEDIEALLEEQRQLFLGLWGQQQRDIEYLEWQLGEAVRTMNNYLMMLGIVIGFVIAYVTRDRWLSRKRKDEEAKSVNEFENFLEAFILERYQSGDQKGEVKADGA